jgi:hypothetical protein
MHRLVFAAMNLNQLPIPPGAVVGDWCDRSFRPLTWSRHDAAGAVISVDGTQYGDGTIERRITLISATADSELEASAARQLAAGLLDAADALDALR